MSTKITVFWKFFYLTDLIRFHFLSSEARIIHALCRFNEIAFLALVFEFAKTAIKLQSMLVEGRICSKLFVTAHFFEFALGFLI